ncbi:MAG: SpoIIE family protein phosphatase [Myxococcota bacterium]|nr:SpoIIE family protein phosphatase [Myxococcota bacterium]
MAVGIIKKINAYFTEKYQDQDFVTQQKVRVVTAASLAIIPPAVILLLNQIFIETTDTTDPVIITGSAALTAIGILLGIRKGHFTKVAHIFPIAALGAVYAVMIFDEGGIVERLDTVTMAVGFLSFTALVITKRSAGFLFYFGCSIIAFLLCTFHIQNELNFPKSVMAEYIVDSLFGMVMVGVTSYLVFSIDKRALDKATSATKIAEGEAEKNRELSRTLELKVKDRTKDLNAAVEKLEVMNAQLTETRDALWGEMQIAKKIQTVLLPEQTKMDGYDITAYMNTADDVGGDYYDVINHNGYDWVVIGDVSGHGVPAGLVMMMVQTAIHATLKMHPDLPPSALLNAVNRAVTENILQMRDNKYMTMTVLSVQHDGTIQFSGLHQDILVYRENAKQVEKIETTGMWVGVVDEIDGMVVDDEMTLRSGDTMLLFTDGLTEAYALDGNTLFGSERVVDILAQCGDQPTETIKTEITQALSTYRCPDDVTFVLVKKH